MKVFYSHNNISPLYRVTLAFLLSGFPLGRALSNLPDMGKAQTAATAILSLLSRHSKIDASNLRGRKLVSVMVVRTIKAQ